MQFRYGTGESVFGGHDLLNWDSKHNVTLKALPVGIEETAVLGLISPPTGTAHLLSVVGDIGGWVHTSFTSPPSKSFATPTYGTTTSIDYAGNNSSQVIRLGGVANSTDPQVAMSNDGGNTWYANYAATPSSQNANMYGGQIAMSANGDTLLWSTSNNGVMRSQYSSGFATLSALPQGAVVASDKVR